MITLAVDASTYVGTAVLIEDGRLLAATEAAMRGKNAEALMPAVAGMLDSAGKPPRALGRVVCGAGPGSFTSLRIAASIAKGLSLGAACPMFAVSSLALLVSATALSRPGRYLGVLDALRGDAYVGCYAVATNGTLSAILPERLVAQSEVGDLANELHAVTVGAGQVIEGSPNARGVLGLERLIFDSGPIDLARWEPDYGRKAEAQARWETEHGRLLWVDPTSV